MSAATNGHKKKGLLERLRDGMVLGDGGMISEMEKRGYVRTGVFTPEVCVIRPQAVTELHREFARAGADVIQALNFFANEKQLKEHGVEESVEEINRAAVRIARAVAAEGGQLVSASLTATPAFSDGARSDEVIAAYTDQLKPVLEEGVDFIICEWFFDIREMELAITAARETGLPVVACMSIGIRGDCNGVTPEECALRMARAGADVVGTNCVVGPRGALQTIRRMRLALEGAGISRPLIVQPPGIKTPEDGSDFRSCPHWPLACETVTLTRFEARLFAREAYNEGVRYIGGCCYFRSHHMRAMGEELSEERGFLPPSSYSGGFGPDLAKSDDPDIAKRCTKEYWYNVRPSTTPQSAVEYFANWKDSTQK